MRTVDAAELGASLTAYLACAKAGESIIIRDHNTPVAKLIPFTEDEAATVPPELALTDADFTAEELALAAAGILTLPKQRVD